MEELLSIGPSTVQVRNPELLSGSLAGLRRLHSDAADNVPVLDATLDVEMRAGREWPLDVSVVGDVHCFGRPTYAVEAAPGRRHLRLLMTALPAGNDLYWIQRDIFGLLACMAGGLMLHGSAVRTPEGDAWVFCGASGVGKSTICRLLVAAGFPAINDEVNWLFHDETGALRIVNQPFWFSEADIPPSLPVARLCLLRQAARCSFQPPLAKSETFVRLLAAHLSIDTAYGFLEARAEALKHLVEGRAIDVLEFNLDTEELLNLLWKNATLKDS